MQPWVVPFLLDPDPHKYVDQLPLSSPMAMQNLYDISFEDILDVLEELGDNLDFDKNPYIHAGNGGDTPGCDRAITTHV